jgi:hypothetical protein
MAGFEATSRYRMPVSASMTPASRQLSIGVSRRKPGSGVFQFQPQGKFKGLP